MTEKNEVSYPSIKQSWGISGLCLLSMILFIPVSILLEGVTGRELSFLIYYILAMGAPFWIAHLKRKKWTGHGEYDFNFGSAKMIVLVTIAAIAIQIGIISPVVSLIPMPESFKEIFLELATRKGVFSFIAIVFAAPILEELIFRGIILHGLLKRYSPLKSILISSVLFGVVHLNPWQFVAAFVIGIFSGWVYFKTKKLTLSIFIHLSNNLLAFTSTYFMNPEQIMNYSLTEVYGGFLNLILITFAAVAATIICLHFIRLEIKNTEIDQGDMERLEGV